MTTEQRGFVQLASSNTAGFNNSLANDLLIYTTSNSQKILIGTQNTNASLIVTSNAIDVSGNINFTGDLRRNGVIFQGGGGGSSVGWTSNATLNTIFTMSNIGIGRTPQVALDVSGNTRIVGGLSLSNVFSNSRLQMWEGVNENEFLGFGINPNMLRYQVANATDDHVFFRGNGPNASVELLRIKGNGNVGVGTATPEERLHVAGKILSSTQFLNASSANSNVPCYSFSGDSNTGMYSAGADTLGFVTGSIERMRVNSSGNVGIGLSNPAYPLEVAGRMRATTSLLVGDSTDTGSSRIISALDSTMTNGSSKFITLGKANSLNNQGELQYVHVGDNSALNQLTLGHFGRASLYILANGNVGINTTSPSERLHVIGKILASDDITAFSDSNYKTNLEPIVGAMNIIENITGYKYNMIDDAPDSKKHVGVLAQQVESLLPEVVHTSTDGKKSVAYGNMIALLIQGMKEMKQEIQELKSLINAA
jgi:hypothetical protein